MLIARYPRRHADAETHARSRQTDRHGRINSAGTGGHEILPTPGIAGLLPAAATALAHWNAGYTGLAAEMNFPISSVGEASAMEASVIGQIDRAGDG